MVDTQKISCVFLYYGILVASNFFLTEAIADYFFLPRMSMEKRTSKRLFIRYLIFLWKYARSLDCPLFKKIEMTNYKY